MSALVALATLLVGDVVLVPWAGHLETAAGPVDGEVSATFRVTDAATDAELLVLADPTFLVVDGDFVLDVPVPVEGTALLHAIVNGETFAPLRVEAQAPVVVMADAAATADVADDTAALDGLVDPVTLAALAPGAVPGAKVAFANVTGVPADFEDGDDGLVLAPDASFSFVDGALTLLPRSVTGANVGALTSADLKDDSVGATQLATNTLTSADLTGTLPLTKVASDTFGLDAFATATTAVEAFEVHVDGCDAPRGTLQVDATCAFTGVQDCTTSIGGNPINGYTDCTGVCRAIPGTVCTLPSAGFLVFP
jgi:hypothetical protein